MLYSLCVIVLQQFLNIFARDEVRAVWSSWHAMHPHRPHALLFLLLLLPAIVFAAQPNGRLVDVVDVSFRSVKAPNNQQDFWYEADILVEVKAGVGQAQQVRTVDRVTFALAFSTEAALAGPAPRVFHRCEAEAVSLALGRHHIRFYLPPEIVKRDAVRGPPKEWLVEIVIKGKALAITPKGCSASLRDSKAMADFREKITTEAPSNDGVLRPQFLTPFERYYVNDTPSFIRRSG